jgi:hypothetical protein
MNNRILILMGIGFAGAVVVGYMLGTASRPTTVVAEAPSPAPKQDSFVKRAALAVCTGLGEGAGKLLATTLVGGSAAVGAV